MVLSVRRCVRQILAGALIMAIVLPAPAGAVTLDEIVVVVNDDVILMSEFQNRKQLILAQIRRKGVASTNDLLVDKRVLDTLILNKLQLQLANINNITIADGEVDRMIADIAAGNNISLGDFREALRQDGFIYNEFREDMREEMLLRRVRRDQVDRRISVSDDEVDYYLLTLERQGAADREYHLAHILLSLNEDDGRDETFLRTEADIIRGRLAADEEFADIASAFSHARDAGEGGDLGWLTLSAVPSLFVDRLAEMKPGDVAGPIQSDSGLHFVKLIDVRIGNLVMRGRVRGQHILIAVTDGDWEQAHARTVQIRERILADEDFAELAQEYSDDLRSAAAGGDLGWIEEDQFPAGMREAVKQLPIDQLSEPLRTSDGFHLIRILEKEQHDATVQVQKEQARETIYQRKLQNARNQWLNLLRSEAYIEIRLFDEAASG